MIVWELDGIEAEIHKGGEMVGFWVREKSGKYPDGKHRLAARGLAARRQRSDSMLQAGELCVGDEYCFLWVRISRWN